MPNSQFGERARVRCGATGRHLGSFKGVDLAMFVCAQDNDLGIDVVAPDGVTPHPTLPVPTDDELGAALVGLSYGMRLRSTRPNSSGGEAGA